MINRKIPGGDRNDNGAADRQGGIVRCPVGPRGEIGTLGGPPSTLNMAGAQDFMLKLYTEVERLGRVVVDFSKFRFKETPYEKKLPELRHCEELFRVFHGDNAEEILSALKNEARLRVNEEEQ